jgi:hypothetical protein
VLRSRSRPRTPLTRSALPVLQSLLGEGLEGRPASVILTGAGNLKQAGAKAKDALKH